MMETSTETSGTTLPDNLLPPHMAQIKIANMQKQIELAEQKARSATLQWTADKVKIKEMKEQHKKEVDDLTTRLTILERKARLQEQLQRDPNMLKGDNGGNSNQNDDDNGNNMSKGQQSSGSKQLAQFDALQFENEITEKKLQIRNLSLQLSELRIQIANLNNKLDIVTKRNEELVKNDDRLSGQLEHLTRENQTLNTTIEELRQAVKNLETALASEKENYSKLQKELAETEARQRGIISNLQAELEVAKTQTKKLNFEKESLQNDNQAKQSEISRLTKENQKLMIEKQQEVRVQQHLLLALQQTAKEVKDYLDSFNKLEQKSNQSSQEMLSSLSVMNKKLVTLHSTIDHIMVEMQTKVQASERLLKEKEEEMATMTEKAQARQAQFEAQINELSLSLMQEKEKALQAELSWANEKQIMQDAQTAADVQIAQLEEEIKKEQAIPGTKYTAEEIEAMKQDVRETTTQLLQLEFETITDQRLAEQKEDLEKEFEQNMEETVRDRLEAEVSRALEELAEAKEQEILAKFEAQQKELLQKVQDLQSSLEQEQQKAEQLRESLQEQSHELEAMEGQNEKYAEQMQELEQELSNQVSGGMKSKPLSRRATGLGDGRQSTANFVRGNSFGGAAIPSGDEKFGKGYDDQGYGDQGYGGQGYTGLESGIALDDVERRDYNGEVPSAPLLQELNFDAIKQLIMRSLITKNFYFNSDANTFLNSYPVDEDFLAELVQSFFAMNHKIYYIIQHSLDALQQQFSSKTPSNFQDIPSLVEEFLFTTAQEIIMKLEKSKESALQQVKKDLRDEMVEKVQEASKKQHEIKILELFELREQHEDEMKKKNSEFSNKIRELEELVEELRNHPSTTDNSNNHQKTEDNIKPTDITKSTSSASTVSRSLSMLRTTSMLFRSRPSTNALGSSHASFLSNMSQDSGENGPVDAAMWDNIHEQWREDLEAELRAQIYEEIMHKNTVHENVLANIGGIDFDNEELTGIKTGKANGAKNYTEDEFLKMREDLLTGELSYIAEVRLENFDRLKNSRFGTDNIIALTILEHHIRYETNPVDNSINPSLTIQSLGGYSGVGTASEEQKQRQYRMQLKSLEIQRTMLLQHILQETSILDLYAFLHTTNRALTLLTTMTSWQSLVHYSQGGNFRDVLEVHRQVLLTCIRAAGGTKAGVKALGFIPSDSSTDMWPEPFRIIALEVFRGELINEQKRMNANFSNDASLANGKPSSPATTKKSQKSSPPKPPPKESSRGPSNSFGLSTPKQTRCKDDGIESEDDEGGEGDDDDASSDHNSINSADSTNKYKRKKFPLTWSVKASSTTTGPRARRANVPTKSRKASTPDLLHMLAENPELFRSEPVVYNSIKESTKRKRFQGSLHAGVDYFVFRAWLGDQRSQQFLEALHTGLGHWEDNHNIQANTAFQQLLHTLTAEISPESEEKESANDLPVGIEVLSQLIRMSLHSDISIEIQEIFQKVHGFLLCLHQGKLDALQPNASLSGKHTAALKYFSNGFFGGRDHGVSSSKEVIMHECAIQTDDNGESVNNLVRRRKLTSFSSVNNPITSDVWEGTLPPGVVCVKFIENMFEIAEGLHLSNVQTLIHDLDLSVNPGKSIEELRELLMYLPTNIRYCRWAAIDINISEYVVDVRMRELPYGLRKASHVFNLPAFATHFPVLFPSVFPLRQGVNLLTGGSYCGHMFPYYHFDIPAANKCFSSNIQPARGHVSSTEKAVHQSATPGVILPPDILFLQCPSEWGLFPSSDLLPAGVSPVKLSHQVAYNKGLLENFPLPPGHELVQMLFPCAYEIPTGVELARGIKFAKLSTDFSLPSNIKVISRFNKTTPLPNYIIPLTLLSGSSSKLHHTNALVNVRDQNQEFEDYTLPWETSLESGVVTIIPKPPGIVFPLGMELIRRTGNVMLPPGMQLVPAVEYPEGLESLADDCELVQLSPRYDFPPACKISPAWYIFPRPTGVRLAPNHYLVYPDPSLEDHMIPPLPSFACVMPMPTLPSGLIFPARTVAVILLLSRFTQYCLPEGATLAPGIAVLNPKNIYKGTLPNFATLVRRPPINVLIVKRTPTTPLPPMVMRGSRSDLPAGYLLGENMDVVRVAVRFEIPAGVLLAPGVLLGPNTQLSPGTLLQSSIIRASNNKSLGQYSEGVKVVEWPYGLVCFPGVELVTCPPEGCYLPFEYTPVQHSENDSNSHGLAGTPLPKLPPKSMLVKLPHNIKLLPAYMLAKDISVGLESMFEEHYSRPLPPGCLFASKKHRAAVWPAECAPLPRSSLPGKLVSLLEDYIQGHPIGEKKTEGKQPKAVPKPIEVTDKVASTNSGDGAQEISERMNIDVISLPAHYILPPGVELISGVKVVAAPFFWSLPSQTALVQLSDPQENLLQLAVRHIYPLDIPLVHLLPPALRSIFTSFKIQSIKGLDSLAKQLDSFFSLPKNYAIIQLPAVYDVHSWGEVLPGVQTVSWETNNPKFPLPPGHFFIERPRQAYSQELPPGFALGIHPIYASFRPPSSTSTQSAIFPPQIEIMHLVPRYYLPRNVTVLNTGIFSKQTFNIHTGGASTYSGPNGQEYVKNSFDPSWIIQLAAFEQVCATSCVLPWPCSALYEPVVYSALCQLDPKLLNEEYALLYFPMHPKENHGLHYPPNMSKHPQSNEIVSLLFNSKIGKQSYHIQNDFQKCIGALLDTCLRQSKDSKQQLCLLESFLLEDILKASSDDASHPWFEDISGSVHVVKMSNGFPLPEERIEHALTATTKINSDPLETSAMVSNKPVQYNKIEVVYPILVNISTRKFHTPCVSAELNTFLTDYSIFHWHFSTDEKKYVEKLLKFRMKDHAVEQALVSVRKLESQQQQIHQELSSKESELSKTRKKFEELNNSYAVMKEQCQKDEDYKGVIQKLKEQLAKQQQALLSFQQGADKVTEPVDPSVLTNQEVVQLQEQVTRAQQQQQVLISQLTEYENQIKELSNKQYQEVLKQSIVTHLQDKLGVHLSSLKELIMSLLMSFSSKFYQIIYEEFHLTEIGLFELLQEAEKLQTLLPMQSIQSQNNHEHGLPVDDEISLITTDGDNTIFMENNAKVRSSNSVAHSLSEKKAQSATVSRIQQAIRHGPYYSSPHDLYPPSTILDPTMPSSGLGDNNSVFSAITSQSMSSLPAASLGGYLPRDLSRDILGKKLKVSQDFPLDVSSLYSRNSTAGNMSNKNNYMSIAKPVIPMAANATMQPIQPFAPEDLPRGVGDLLTSKRKKVAEETGVDFSLVNSIPAIISIQEVHEELKQLGNILNETMHVIVTHSAYTSGLRPSFVFPSSGNIPSTSEGSSQSPTQNAPENPLPGVVFVSDGAANGNVSLVRSINWQQLTVAFDQVMQKLLLFSAVSVSRYRQTHDHLLRRMELENSQLHKAYHSLSVHDSFVCSLITQPVPVAVNGGSGSSIRSSNSMTYSTATNSIVGSSASETVAQLQERLFRTEKQYQDTIESLLQTSIQPVQHQISQYVLLHEQLTSYQFHIMLLKQTLQQDESGLSLLSGSGGMRASLSLPPGASFNLPGTSLPADKKFKAREPAKSSLTENLLSRSWEENLLQKKEDSLLSKALTYRISKVHEKLFWLQEKEKFIKNELQKTLGIIHELMEKNMSEIQGIIPAQLMNALLHYKQGFYEKLKFQPRDGTVMPEFKLAHDSNSSVMSSGSVGSGHSLLSTALPMKAKLGSIGSLPPAGVFSHLTLKRNSDTLLPKKTFSKTYNS